MRKAHKRITAKIVPAITTFLKDLSLERCLSEA
jgi:hypothetical protein